MNECDSKGTYVPCPQCGESLTHDELEMHTRGEAECYPPAEDEAHCPLCHQNIDSSEDSWKLHLMNQCGQNPRRLLAMQKKAKPKPAQAPANANALGSRTHLPSIPSAGKQPGRR